VRDIEKEVGPFVPHYPGEIYALGREEKFVREIEQMTHKTIQTMDFLMKKEPWDLFVGVIQSPDLIQHCLWRFEDKGHPLYTENRHVTGAILKCYQAIDHYLGNLLHRLDDHTLLFVISDHGFGRIEKQFFVNNWLLEEGFLVLKKTPLTFIKKAMFNLGIVPMKIHKFIASLGIDLSKALAKNSDRVFTGLNKWILSFEDVDWSRSQAYAMGNMGFINVNLRGREPQGIVEPGADHERVLDEISERLFFLKDRQLGTPLVDRILRNKEMYWGPRASQGPDLFLVVKDYAYCLRGDYLFITNRVFEDLWLISGSHRPNGILLGKGVGLKQGHRITGASIMDIGPTILGLMEGLIPEDMDGKFLLDLLTEERRKGISIQYISSETDASTETSLSEEEEKLLRKQLKGLGYLA
jgi:predicted AlkP superfamily phosphohydrolase/phosphomutase